MTSNMIVFGFALSVLAMILWVFGVIPWFIGYGILTLSASGFFYGSRQRRNPDSGWAWLAALMIGILASAIAIIIGLTGLIFPFTEWTTIGKFLFLAAIAGVIGLYMYFQNKR